MTTNLLEKEPEVISDTDTLVVATTTTIADQETITASTRQIRRVLIPFKGGYISLDDPPPWFSPIIQSMEDLLKLTSNWDSYGASPIDPKIIAIGFEILLETMKSNSLPPTVVPTSRGGIQLEWHSQGIDLEININSPDEINIFFQDLENREEVEGEYNSNLENLKDLIPSLSSQVTG